MQIKHISFSAAIYLFLTLINISAGRLEDELIDELDYGSYYVPAEIMVHPMSEKFFRGIINTSTGWGELPRQLILTSLDNGVIKGFTWGVLKGVLMTLIRTGTGIYDGVFFVSSAPGYYAPLIDPPYVWQSSIDMVAENY